MTQGSISTATLEQSKEQENCSIWARGYCIAEKNCSFVEALWKKLELRKYAQGFSKEALGRGCRNSAANSKRSYSKGLENSTPTR